jgi:hypothetical protein
MIITTAADPSGSASDRASPTAIDAIGLASVAFRSRALATNLGVASIRCTS